MTRERSERWFILLTALAIAAGGWARCNNWREVFVPSGPELLPSDSHYYVRFALLQLRSFPHFRAFDPYVNAPGGARILWPPVHAWWAMGLVLLGGVSQPELGAAWVDPAAALVELCIVAALCARWWSWRRAAWVSALWALTPAAVAAGRLGDADHHVHEVFLAAVAVLAGMRGQERGSTAAALGGGVFLGAGRLLTTISFALVPCIALSWLLAAAASEADRRRRLARGAFICGVGCTLASLGSVLLWGERGLDYARLTAFHPLFSAVLFAGCGGCALLVARDRRGWAAIGVAAALCVPLGGELTRALGHLGRADPVLSFIDESLPLLREPRWAVQLLGATLFALPFGAWGAVRLLRSGDAPQAAAPLVATALLLVAAAAQARFVQPLSGALAVLLPVGLDHVLPSRWRFAVRAGAAVGLASLLVGLVPRAAAEPPDLVMRTRPTLRWMKDHLPAASADPYGTQAAYYAISAHPLLGNLILLWAERPVLATMFAQSRVHVAGIIANAGILAATDDEVAFSRAKGAGARFVLATPSDRLIGADAFDAKGSLLGRLVNGSGVDPEDPRRTTAHFRLAHESEELRDVASKGSYTQVFEVVEGAVLSGSARPGGRIRASRPVRTSRGRLLEYVREVEADAAGRYALRVPYACEDNQACYSLEVDGEVHRVGVTEEQIQQGAVIHR